MMIKHRSHIHGSQDTPLESGTRPERQKEAFEEIRFAKQQFRKLRIPTLDVTELTVEESAARIVELLHSVTES